MGRAVASSFRPRFAAFFGISAALALSGCIGNSVFDDLNAAQPVGSPFSEALFKNYAFLARSFGTQSDPSGQAFDAEGAISLTGADNTISGVADTYAQKALLIAKGEEDVLPEPAPDGDTDAENVRLELLRDLSDGREKAPEIAARAQADYDCWIVNRRVDSLAAASQACRRSVTASLAKLEHGLNPPSAAPVSSPAPAAAPVQFTVSFTARSARLSADQLSTISQAIAAARSGRQSHISVVGHVDTAETSTELAQRRADAVEKALVEQGARADAITASGAGKGEEPHDRVAVITLIP